MVAIICIQHVWSSALTAPNTRYCSYPAVRDASIPFDYRVDGQPVRAIVLVSVLAVLNDFAEHFGVGQDKRIVLPLDQAGWHMSDKLEVPEGIHVLPMPLYSPELQSAERLWPLVNEVLANQVFESIE